MRATRAAWREEVFGTQPQHFYRLRLWADAPALPDAEAAIITDFVGA